MRRRRVSARTRTWIRPLGISLAGLGLVSVLFVAGVGDVGLPEWLALAAPPAAYLVVSLAAWRRTPLSARLKWAALTYSVHLTLGVALAAVFVSIRPIDLADALGLVFWGFLPALLVPMLTAPLIVPRPRAMTRWLRARDPIGSRRESRLVPSPLVVVGHVATLSFPAEDPLASPTPAQLALALSAAEPSSADGKPGSTDDETSPADDAARAPDAVLSAAAERVDEGPIGSDPVLVDGEQPIRIPFVRVAAQLPTNAFVLPPERLAASLREPGQLVIPLRLILPQLAEGSVEIAWALVDSQFPELAFAEQSPEFGDRFPELNLTLPIDEIVRQLPAEIFRVAAPAIDLHAIESFPPPFQPFVTTMESGASVAAELAQFLQRSRGDAPPQSDGPAGDGGASSLDTALALEAPPSPAGPSDARPIEAETAEVHVPEAHVDDAGETGGPLEDATAAAHQIATQLAPVGSFEASARRVGGRLVLAFVAPGLDAGAVVRTAAHVAPLVLAEGAETGTLRASHAALVVAGSRVADEDALVVAAVRPGAPLALLELLVRRATDAASASGAVSSEGACPDPAARAGLRPAHGDVERRLAGLGAGPSGFGRVTPAAFVDGASGVNVYVFHAHGLEARTLGAMASRVHAALAADAAGAFGSLTLRQGERRTFVRTVAGASSPGVVAASGPVTLAGLAGREVERVAQALEAA